MGNKCCCRCKKKTTKKIVLLLVGLDNAGKTVAAKGLAGESVNSVVPTVGFSVVDLKYHKYNVKLYDLGGGANIRGIWHKYFVDVHGVIFVIDSSDTSRFEEVKLVLNDLLMHRKISGKPLLILANKQDNENALDEIDVIEHLDIEMLVNNNQCPTMVETCAAKETSNKNKLDAGIKKGYEWLLTYIIRNYETLNGRVQTDVKEQEIIERKQMQEKIERIRKSKEQEAHRLEEDAIESYSDYARKLNGEIIQVASLNEASNSNNLTINQRPKSAVEIVKDQLKQNKVANKKPKLFRTNKTTPMAIYDGVKPQSAREKRKKYSHAKRLKSADESGRSTSNLVDREVFSLSEKILPIHVNVRSKVENGYSRTKNDLATRK